MVIVTLGAVSAVIDGWSQKLPLVITLFIYLEFTVLVLVAVTAGEVLPAASMASGAAVWTIPLTSGYLVGRQVGAGDVILAPAIGLWLGLVGFDAAVAGLCLAAVLAGLWAVTFHWVDRKKGAIRLPFGPFMFVGAVGVAALFFVRTTSHVGGGCGKLLSC